MGANGCGKTTLLRALAGLDPPLAGTILWDGQPLPAGPARVRALGVLFQQRDAGAVHRARSWWPWGSGSTPHPTASSARRWPATLDAARADRAGRAPLQRAVRRRVAAGGPGPRAGRRRAPAAARRADQPPGSGAPARSCAPCSTGCGRGSRSCSPPTTSSRPPPATGCCCWPAGCALALGPPAAVLTRRLAGARAAGAGAPARRSRGRTAAVPHPGGGMNPAVLIVGHGSREERANRELEALVAAYRARLTGAPEVAHAYVELARPAARRGAGRPCRPPPPGGGAAAVPVPGRPRQERHPPRAGPRPRRPPRRAASSPPASWACTRCCCEIAVRPRRRRPAEHGDEDRGRHRGGGGGPRLSRSRRQRRVLQAGAPVRRGPRLSRRCCPPSSASPPRACPRRWSWPPACARRACDRPLLPVRRPAGRQASARRPPTFRGRYPWIRTVVAGHLGARPAPARHPRRALGRGAGRRRPLPCDTCQYRVPGRRRGRLGGRPARPALERAPRLHPQPGRAPPARPPAAGQTRAGLRQRRLRRPRQPGPDREPARG